MRERQLQSVCHARVVLMTDQCAHRSTALLHGDVCERMVLHFFGFKTFRSKPNPIYAFFAWLIEINQCLTDNSFMNIAILTFDGFNELDSLIALGVLNRIKRPGWRVSLMCPTPTVTSMNGVTVHAQSTLDDISAADAVIVGSGIKTREIANDAALMARIKLDPARQLIAAQCSGTLLLAKLGLLGSIPACTDLTTKPWVVEAGVDVLNQPFFARDNVATAGGCMASPYLAAWIIARSDGMEAAQSALHYVAPVGEKEAYVERAIKNIAPYLIAEHARATT
jgi:putative intracellular protease/amidase